jgi:glycosyltransferase involved in cell wall biosynthesis
MTSGEKEYVLVTEYFHPDTASTGQLMTDLAVGLEERGLDMTVYTGQPNYHSGDNEKQPRVSTYENVLVKRIRAPQVRQSSLPRRLFNWGVFTVWMFFALLVSRSDRDREMIFVSNPPFLPVAMWLVCRIRGWESTYIVYDLYPDQPIELNHIREGGLIDRVWSDLNRRAFLSAKHVVALGPVMKDRISEQAGSGFDEDKITIIHNWEDEDFIEPMDKGDNWFSHEHDLVEPFTILYSGNIGEFHDLETLVEAAAQFDDENVKVLIIGEGDNKAAIVDQAERLGLRGETVVFLPYQPWDDLTYSLTSGDVSVVTVKEGFEGVCVSSKLYSAMAAGMPILGIVQPDDDEASIIDAFDAGYHAEQGDVDGIAEAIEAWRSNPERRAEQGENARVAFEEYFTKDHSVDRYYQLLVGEPLETDVTQSGTTELTT